MLNLHNFLNVNIPVLTQSFLFVCYCLSHEIDFLISLSAEKGSSAFSNHRGKSNKLPTSRMHLQHPHACAFPADSPIKITSLWPSHLILESYHLRRFLLLEGQPKCLQKVQCEFFNLSWTPRDPPATQDLLWGFQGSPTLPGILPF